MRLLIALAFVASLAAPALAADKAPIVVPPPPAGKGQIVFYRTGGFAGSMISCAMKEGETKLSSLPPGKYYVHVTEPGKHSYSVSSEATDTLNVEIEPDDTQYSRCTIRMGVMAGRPNLSPATIEEWNGHSPKLKPIVPKDK
jgi:hypothetical protein